MCRRRSFILSAVAGGCQVGWREPCAAAFLEHVFAEPLDAPLSGARLGVELLVMGIQGFGFGDALAFHRDAVSG